MATRALPHSGPTDATALMQRLTSLIDDGELDELSEPHVIGMQAAHEQLRLHLAPLPPDDRCAAAGMFGMRAKPNWCAVGLALHGRARDLDSDRVVGSAAALVIVDREGILASTLHLHRADAVAHPYDALADAAPTWDSGPPVGLTIDALHRMLRLPVPGEAPPTPLFALALWSQDLICHTLDVGATSWADAVRLHPGCPAHGTVEASVETVVEATLRTDGLIDWRRLHRRGCAGGGPSDLSRAEARWMDPTMYARWVLGALPDPAMATHVLSVNGSHRAAAAVAEVSAAVSAAVTAEVGRV